MLMWFPGKDLGDAMDAQGACCLYNTRCNTDTERDFCISLFFETAKILQISFS